VNRLLAMSITRTVPLLRLSRRTFALVLAVAFALGVSVAVWLCVLLIR